MTVQQSRPSHFLAATELPAGFVYPKAYVDFVSKKPFAVIGPINEDWCFIEQDSIENFRRYVKRAAPNLPLVPFMRRNGDDGVACLLSQGIDAEPTVYIANVFQDIGAWGTSQSFAAWLLESPPRDADDEA